MSAGVDLSNNNPSFNDWNGVEFAFLKASESTGFSDGLFTGFVMEASRRGIPWGPYHFPHPDVNAADVEARFFLSHFDPTQTPLAAALDIESRKDHNILAIMGPGALADWSNRWCEIVRDATGKPPFVYLNRSYGKALLPLLSKEWPLWLATAVGAPGTFTVYESRDVAIEQWGQAGGVDRNESYVPLVAAPNPQPITEENQMFIIKGDASGEWWLTDWLTKRYLHNVDPEVNNIRFISAKYGAPIHDDGGNPIIVPQAVVDFIPRNDLPEAAGGGSAPTHFQGTIDLTAK